MKEMSNMNNNYNPYVYPHPYYVNNPMYNWNNMYNCNPHPSPYWVNTLMHNPAYVKKLIKLKDYGPEPFVINIEKATLQNNNFRIALWTGKHLQLTLMTIKAGEDIGLEIHPELDQFIRIEQGQGLVKMGDSKNKLDFQRKVHDDYAIIIPAGKWHNLINTGSTPLKLYSIYAPPEHPFGTVHETKADAKAEEKKTSHV